MYFP
jgi:hypothetical protein